MVAFVCRLGDEPARVKAEAQAKVDEALDRAESYAPHALHSLDPQGGVDIAEVKRRYGDRVCLVGNVNCGKLDTGTDS
jgi:uroporphyrinogen-III decarboxylase